MFSVLDGQLTTAGAAGLFQVRGNMEAGPHGGFYIIDPNGFHAFIQFLANEVGDASLRKNHVAVVWFIRNHAQGGPTSATAGSFDSYGRNLWLRLEKLLDHLCSFFSHLKHLLLHDKVQFSLIVTDPRGTRQRC